MPEKRPFSEPAPRTRGSPSSPGPSIASARPADGGHVVEIAATSLVEDVTLLAGERCSIRVTSTVDLDPAALTDPAVLRSANDLMRPAGGRGARG